MLLLPTAVAHSEIHGRGLFAAVRICAGEVVWQYAEGAGWDDRIPLKEADDAARHFGYVNPANPRQLVRCGDAARFWNFSALPNCGEQCPPTATAESPIIALRDIAAGEELTLGTATDADAARKLSPTNTDSHG